MNIVVYCGSLDGSSAHGEAARALGKMIGTHGDCLVFGASECGLMGVLSNSAKDNGARIHGVGLEMFQDRVGAFGKVDELYIAKTFAERKTKMIELGDAFVALPGGTGTLDEISEVLCLKPFYFPKKPVFLLNINGFYDDLAAFFKKVEAEGLLYPDAMNGVYFVSSVADIEGILYR